MAKFPGVDIYKNATSVSLHPDDLTSTTAAGDGDGTLIPHKPSTTTLLSLIDHALDSRNPVIVKAAILLTVSVIGLIGNSFALTTIRVTPKLRTKTFLLLSSLTVSDLVTALTMFWYVDDTLNVAWHRSI